MKEGERQHGICRRQLPGARSRIVMAIHRKSIALTEAENALLKRLYLRWGIPIDQYEKRPHDLAALLDTWNARSDRSDTTQDVMHYMKTRRKRGLWVTF